MTAIKVSQLPEASVISVNDEIILNDVDVTPVATTKATLATVFAFAETQLTFNTSQIQLVNPQNVNYAGIPGRPELGGPVVGRTIVSGVLPPIGSLNTQEEYNIWLVNAVVALDDEIDRIEEDGVGVVSVTAGTGLVTSPVDGITSSGTISVGDDVVLTDTNQTITGQKTLTAPLTLTSALLAQSTIRVSDAATFLDNIVCTKNVTAAAFIGDGSQLTGIVLPETTGTVKSVTPGDGLLQGTSSGTNNNTPITSTGTISVDNSVLRTTGDQNIAGVKTFTSAAEFDGGLKTSGDITPVTAVTIGAANTTLLGDGSNLTGLPTQGITSVTPADGLMSGATSGAGNDNPITSAGSISVDNTVVRTNASDKQLIANDIAVAGEVEAVTFVGDGSQLTGIPESGITNLVPADGIMLGATSGASNNTPITSTGSISVDNTVVRTNSSSTQNIANDVTVAGTLTAANLVGDGSGITNLPAGTGTVTSVVPADGLMSGATSGTGNDDAITGSGSISVDDTVVRTNSADPQIVANNFTVQGDVTATNFIGNGSQLTGLPDSGITNLVPADGLMNGATSGTPNNTAVTSTGSISVDNTVVRTNASGTQTLGGALTVDGNITSTNGIFIGDGSGLSNISAVAGPFVFAGTVDAVNGTPPTDPAPADAFIYFNTVAGTVNNNWPGIEGDTIGVDQMVVYSGTLSGWALGSAVDRGTFVAVDGGTMTGSLIIEQNLSVTGGATITGSVTANGGITGDLTGNVTGDVTGDLTGNADTATAAGTANKSNTSLISNAGGTDDLAITLAETGVGDKELESSSQLTFNPGTQTLATSKITTTGSVTATGGFVGDLTGNADTATTATNTTNAINATNVGLALATGSADFFVPFAAATTGDQPLVTDAEFKFNSDTNKLTVGSIDTVGDITAGGSFVGDLTGNADTASNATRSGATNTVLIAAADGTDNLFLTLAGPGIGDKAIKTDTQIFYNPDTDLLTTGNVTTTGDITAGGDFIGDLTGNVTGNADTATTAITAANADLVTVALAAGSDDFFLALTPATSGNQALKADGNLLFNAETDTFGVQNIACLTLSASTTITAVGDITTTTGKFVGPLTGDVTGNADTATTAVTATTSTKSDTVKVVTNTTDATFNVPFVTSVGEYEEVLKNPNLKFNPSTDILSVLNIDSTSVTTTSATVSGTLTSATISNSGAISTKNLTVAGGTLTSTDNTLTNLTTSGDVSMVDADITGTLTVDTADIDTGAIKTITTEGIVSTGSIEVQGTNANGDPFTFIGDGSGLTNLQISGAEGGTVTSITAGTGLKTPEGTPNPITGAGTITIDDTVITTEGGQTINGELDVEKLAVTTGDENTDSITAPGIIRGGYFVGDGSGLVNLPAGTGTVTSVTAAVDGGITTSPAEGITTSGTLSVDSTVVRTTGLQEIGGVKNFTAKGDFQAGLDIEGDVGGVNAVYYGDGSNLTGVTNNPGTVTSVSAGSGLATSLADDAPITGSGSLSVDDTVVRTTGNQSIGGTKTFTASNTFNLDTTFSQNVDVTGNVTAAKFIGDGSELSGIKAGMFAFKGNTSVLGDAPSAEAGDVFQNTTAGDATETWTGIVGLPVAENQLVIYGLGGDGVNAWVRGAIADTGQFLSTAGGTVDGDLTVDGDVNVSGTITGTLSGTATSATQVTKDVNAGDGLQGGGELTDDITLSVKTNGDTIVASADGIRVDGTKIDAATAVTATTATNATNVGVTQINSDGTYYITAAQGTSGNQPLKSATGVYINPAEGAIYATTFEGSGADLTGIVYDTTNQDVAGVKNFTSFPTVPAGDDIAPSSNNQVVSKKYVDDKFIAAGSGTVVSVGVIANGGLITSLPNNGAITTSGNLGVDPDAVVMVDSTQDITGTKTFTVDTNFSLDVHVTGTVIAGAFEGDGSGLTNLPASGGTVTTITAGSGIATSPAEGITETGSISVDGSVLRNSGAQSIQTGGSLTVGGNIKVTDGGKFEGDGSLLTNLPIALGPFEFKGEVDVTTDQVPGTLENGDVYVNTTAGTVTQDWTGIEGQSALVDQLVVYSTAGTPGWLLGSALDRGQFVPTSGGTFTGPLTAGSTFNATGATTLASTLSVTGTSTLTGEVSSGGGFTCTGSGVFTGDLVGNAATATNATTADTATTATNATTADTATKASTVTVATADDDVDYYLTFAQVGDKPVYANSALAFNPTDGIVEVGAKIESSANITTTGNVSASNLSGNGASVTNVDALTCQKAVTAGSGLTGGGTLSADVTLNIGGSSSITVNADDIEVKVKAGGGITVDSDGLSVDFTKAPPSASISTTPPSSAVAGDLWWDSDSGEMYIYYVDPDSSQWVSVTPLVATQAAAITALQAQVNTLLARVTTLEAA